MDQEFGIFTGIPANQPEQLFTPVQIMFTYALCNTFWSVQFKKLMNSGPELSTTRANIIYSGLSGMSHKIAEQKKVYGMEFDVSIRSLSSDMLADHEKMSVDDFNIKYRGIARDLGLNYVIRG